MTRPQQLLARLDAIGRSLEDSGHARALLALGSVGLETERLDAFSDLDFFVLVEDGRKARYLGNLDWLSAAGPVVYSFQNTVDGHKALYADGIFCEFAVFEEGELAGIPFSRGRFVWRAAGVPDALAEPVKGPEPLPARSVEWLVGEALTNVYVGLGRALRGELLAGFKLVQVSAVDRLVELVDHLDAGAGSAGAHRDPFNGDRRLERRHPELLRELPRLVPGYAHTPESALAILGFLETRVPVNGAMSHAIRALAQPS